MKLYKFYWEGHNNQIEGLFLATPKEIEEIIGQVISIDDQMISVEGIIDEENITELSISSGIARTLLESNGENPTLCGYNPLLKKRFEEDE